MEGLLLAAVALDEPEDVVLLFFGKLYYLYPILDLVAGILCLAYSGLSTRLIVAGIGFLGEAVVFVIRELTMFFTTLEEDHILEGGFEIAHGMFTVVGLIFATLVVVGLALAFVDLQRQLFAAKRTPPRREEADDASPRWQRR